MSFQLPKAPKHPSGKRLPASKIQTTEAKLRSPQRVQVIAWSNVGQDDNIVAPQAATPVLKPKPRQDNPKAHVIEENLQQLYDLQHDQDVQTTVHSWFSKPPRKARDTIKADNERQVVIYNRLARRQSSDPTDQSELYKEQLAGGEEVPSQELLSLSKHRMDNPRKWFEPQDLALLGDAVWDLYIDRILILGFDKQQEFRLNASVARSGAFKAYALRVLLDGFDLSKEEQAVIRWVLSAKQAEAHWRMNRRGSRQALAMEAYTGYMYLTDPERLHFVMQTLGLEDYEVLQETAEQLAGPQVIDERIFGQSVGTLPLGYYGEDDLQDEWEKQAKQVVKRRKHFDWLLNESTGGVREQIHIQTLDR